MAEIVPNTLQLELPIYSLVKYEVTSTADAQPRATGIASLDTPQGRAAMLFTKREVAERYLSAIGNQPDIALGSSNTCADLLATLRSIKDFGLGWVVFDILPEFGAQVRGFGIDGLLEGAEKAAAAEAQQQP